MDMTRGSCHMMQVLSSLRDSASIHCPKIKTGKIENLKSDKLISMQGINLEKVPHTNPPFQLPRQKGISYDLDSSMMLNMQKSVCQTGSYISFSIAVVKKILFGEWGTETCCCEVASGGGG